MDGQSHADIHEGDNIKKYTFFMSPSANNICMICREDITVKYANSSDNSRKVRLWDHRKEKTSACKEIESFLEVSFSYYTDFHSTCQGCYRGIKTMIKNKSKREEMIQSSRLLAAERFVRTRESIINLNTQEENIHQKIQEANEDSFQTPLRKKLRFEEDSTFPSSTPYSTATGTASTSSINSSNEDLPFMQSPASSNNYFEVIIRDETSVEKYNFPAAERGALTSLLKKDIASLLEESLELYNEAVTNFVKERSKQIVEKEIEFLCSNSNQNSRFKISDINDADKISFNSQLEEVKKNAPLTKDLMFLVATNPRIKRNKIKTEESLIPSVMNSFSTLLVCRNKSMNANAIRNTLALRRGKASKMCITRFQSLSLCLSTTSALSKQLDIDVECEQPVKAVTSLLNNQVESLVYKINKSLYESFDKEIPIELVQDSKQSSMSLTSTNDESFFDQASVDPKIDTVDLSILSDTNTETTESDIEILENDDTTDWNPFVDFVQQFTTNKGLEDVVVSFEPKLMFVGDNVDIRTKRRNYAIDRSNIDHHLYNILVVENRIPIPRETIGRKALHYQNGKDVPMSHFLPTPSDENKLREEVKILLARDLVKYIKELSWMKKFVIRHIPHEYSSETSQKSKVYPLGVLNENETTTEGMIEIMKYQQKLVPGNNSNHLLRMFSIGDLLTVERQQNAQEDLRDSPTHSSRLEGLIPSLADFHTYGNFMEVIWHILYNPSSADNIGTLFQARNFLNARSVPGAPMKDLNACEDLILKFCESLVISAFNHFVKTTQINVNERESDEENEKLMNEILDALVEKYILPSSSDLSSNASTYGCPFCRKSFQKSKSLNDHIKSKHPNQINVVSHEDAVCNYSKNALTLGYIVKNFLDARKHGDGGRIMNLYKFLLIYFKVDNRTKYSFQSLHLLAQTSYLLPPALAHELTWNRFVNNKGFVDTNIELDRHLEHMNKYVKAELATYQGKLTEKSIKRCSSSYSKMQDVMNSFDAELGISTPSGRHTKLNWDDDVLELSEQYDQANLFVFTSGRYHSSFPGFPVSYPAKMNVCELKGWIQGRLKHLQNMNIYKIDDIVTGI